MNKHILWAVLLSIFSAVHVYAQSAYLSKAEMQEDLAYLRQELIAHHPNLYVYSTAEEVDQWFEHQSAHLPDSMPIRETYALIASLSEVLKDGHSYVYPSAKHLDRFFTSAPLFPLDLFLSQAGLMVMADYSDEQEIPIGSILMSINAVPMDMIQSTILQGTSRDGNNLAYPTHLYSRLFPAYHSFFYGFQDSFRIEYEHPTEGRQLSILQGKTRTEIQRAKQEDTQDSDQKGIALDIDADKQLARLIIPSFDKTRLHKAYGQRFKAEVRQAFTLIQQHDISTLIIDLRDNQGGNLSHGVYLLQHVMQAAFQTVHSFSHVKLDKQTGKHQVKQLNTKWDNDFRPKKKKHFDRYISSSMVAAFLTQLSSPMLSRSRNAV